MANRNKALKNVAVTYGSTEITDYLNKASLERTVEAIDTTVFSSDGKVNTAGAPSASVSVGGPWGSALDAVLGPDSIAPPATLKNLIYSVGPTGGKVIHTWTGTEVVGAFISNYVIDASSPTGIIMWTGTLTISGIPVRTTG
jgi:hypothetical protein